MARTTIVNGNFVTNEGGVKIGSETPTLSLPENEAEKRKLLESVPGLMSTRTTSITQSDPTNSVNIKGAPHDAVVTQNGDQSNKASLEDVSGVTLNQNNGDSKVTLKGTSDAVIRQGAGNDRVVLQMANKEMDYTNGGDPGRDPGIMADPAFNFHTVADGGAGIDTIELQGKKKAEHVTLHNFDISARQGKDGKVEVFVSGASDPAAFVGGESRGDREAFAAGKFTDYERVQIGGTTYDLSAATKNLTGEITDITQELARHVIAVDLEAPAPEGKQTGGGVTTPVKLTR